MNVEIGAKTNSALPTNLKNPKPKIWFVAISRLAGLCVLLLLALIGGDTQKEFHLTLPGPVIGLVLLAAIFLLIKRFHAWSHRHLSFHLEPVSRSLISHMGLLFVPAGVGIITKGDMLRREWLPLVAALFGSTLIGLAATAWFMHRFSPSLAPKTEAPKTKES